MDGRVVRGALAGAAVGALGAALAATGVGQGAERAVTDSWQVLAAGAADAPVVIVAIDDETLRRFPEPMMFWGPRFAKAVQTARASGATVVGLDVAFEASVEDFLVSRAECDGPAARGWDAPLRQALAPPGVVLVSSLVPEGDGHGFTPLRPDLAILIRDDLARIGVSNLVPERGVIRHVRPAVGTAEVPRRLALSLLLAVHHLGLDPSDTSWTMGGRTVSIEEGPLEIPWSGPGTVPRVPFWKLADPDLLTPSEAAAIRGRVALIGATHAASQDRFVTPFDHAWPLGGRGPTFGVEAHAQAVGAWLTGRRVRALPAGLVAALLTTLGAASGAWLARASLRAALTALGVAGVALPIGSFAAFAGAGVVAPTVLPVAVVGLSVAVAYVGRYRVELRERDRVRRIFERYVSDDVVAELLASPAALRLGGHRRDVTILFTDIRGFTTLSERLPAEQVVELLNAWLGRACRPILENGGHVDKFSGDGLMAVFGAPAAHADHADRALRAAIAIGREVEPFREWLAARFVDDLTSFDVGIGLHTGQPVVGNVGFERRTEYTVIGDPVNVAARIEGLTRRVGCRILVSEAVVRAASIPLRLGAAHQLDVKGRVGLVDVVELRYEDRT